MHKITQFQMLQRATIKRSMPGCFCPGHHAGANALNIVADNLNDMPYLCWCLFSPRDGRRRRPSPRRRGPCLDIHHSHLCAQHWLIGGFQWSPIDIPLPGSTLAYPSPRYGTTSTYCGMKRLIEGLHTPIGLVMGF